MNKTTKYRILCAIAFFIIFLIIWYTLNFTFEKLDGAYRAMISGGLSAILAPRVHKVKTQSGSQIYLKWIFLKKPISI